MSPLQGFAINMHQQIGLHTLSYDMPFLQDLQNAFREFITTLNNHITYIYKFAVWKTLHQTTQEDNNEFIELKQINI